MLAQFVAMHLIRLFCYVLLENFRNLELVHFLPWLGPHRILHKSISTIIYVGISFVGE